MIKIEYNNTVKYDNSDLCKNYVYDIDDEEVGISNSIINGIYPENGVCVNEKCKELIYVLDGEGKIVKGDEEMIFSKGDSIIIDRGEKYYWNAHCSLLAICAPKWFEEQHKVFYN